ncbi:uncharacterized protein I303_104684 [Kwoniella dejecticola CBS 10117]|uniref:DUF7729 domain-containing protein n=1 Tax=Kwoniella dejecticola CBS 10117 TaxID=1296121 RepID=A0A1A6A4M5_9TREE|nr:uncharacterized protein I303_04336 [Kwoniella dejecticola CBS 10117]OBR85009.1 hypothetical protein I303_04336 [Kwoniella dejecticola CBS 10117]
MKTQFVLSLVLGLMMSRSNASAHAHGIRSRHRSNDPAKRIHLDEIQSDIPPPPVADISTPQHDIETDSISDVIYARADSSNSSTSSITNSSAANSMSSSLSSSSSSSLPLPPSPAVTTLPKPIPKPLDLSISTSLSSSCMVYLTTLLSTQEFISDCLPFSLLLTTSTSYSSLLSSSIQSGNFTTINNLISYTSSPGAEDGGDGSGKCEEYMNTVESALTSNKNCGTDLSNKNQVVKQTKNSLGNYKLIKEVSALVDEDTGVYCYLQAVRSKRPDDAYLWNLPSGIPMPDKSVPTCSSCSRSLLNTYSEYTSTTPTLNATLVKQAINRVNDACGASFVNLSAVALSSSSVRSVHSSMLFNDLYGWFLGSASMLMVCLLVI